MKDEPTLTSQDVVDMSGATYRQLDYWTRTGLLRPTGGRGSGDCRRWTPTQAVQARVARVLRDMGAAADAVGAAVEAVAAGQEGWLLLTGRVVVRRDRWGRVERRWEGEARRWAGEPGEGWLVDVSAAAEFVADSLDGAQAVA